MAQQRTLTARTILNSLAARLTVFTTLVSTYVWAFWFNSRTIGYVAEIKDKATAVSAGTSIAAITVSVFFVIVYLILLNHRLEVQNDRIAPMWCRVSAFAIDFWFALFTLSSLSALIPLVSEAERTGAFNWHFQRDYAVPADGFGAVLVLGCLCALVAYFVLPLMRGGQTVGGWILHLATVNADGYVIHLPLSGALRRIWWEFRGLCSPIKSLKKRDSEGRTFYDIESGFTVIRY